MHSTTSKTSSLELTYTMCTMSSIETPTSNSPYNLLSTVWGTIKWISCKLSIYAKITPYKFYQLFLQEFILCSNLAKSFTFLKIAFFIFFLQWTVFWVMHLRRLCPGFVPQKCLAVFLCFSGEDDLTPKIPAEKVRFFLSPGICGHLRLLQDLHAFTHSEATSDGLNISRKGSLTMLQGHWDNFHSCYTVFLLYILVEKMTWHLKPQQRKSGSFSHTIRNNQWLTQHLQKMSPSTSTFMMSMHRSAKWMSCVTSNVVTWAGRRQLGILICFILWSSYFFLSYKRNKHLSYCRRCCLCINFYWQPL